ncbi:MAG TPA: alpha-amylase family glycosyl hydrolase [Saprospiraceae bacterium]|nr:alpha-amylase family glycosyl hydrolase [Saprospiraceae bacterium]HNT20390.1 alpha-amylase family glycosyl hydrolase [Saprospiraceae bacterium]
MPFKQFLIGLLSLFCLPDSLVLAQLLEWAPAFPKAEDTLRIVMDATKGNKGLLDYNGKVYVHIGVITSASSSSSDWKYVPFTWGSEMAGSQAVNLGKNRWQYSIPGIRSFFKVPSSEKITHIAILFRAGGCSNCAAQRNRDGSDMYIPVYDDKLATRFIKPAFQPLYKPIPEIIEVFPGQSLPIEAVSNAEAEWELFLNQQKVGQYPARDTLAVNLDIPAGGSYTVTVAAHSANQAARDSFAFFLADSIVKKPLPEGVKPGINYEEGDTSLILVLVAPFKNRVAVIGDFPGSNWSEKQAFQMNKADDGRTWWLRITGLSPGVEYAFQYLVDGSLKITDPYTEKILDPVHDPFLSAETYPGLKAYPTGQTTGIVGVVETRRPVYAWQNTFNRPEKTNLIIYELLLRDFLAKHDWKTLTDTLNYLSRLGVNAIELMPVQEFDGNQSWGYNPSFFFAPDKYYGPENDLRQFIDSCHGRGIAVILDLVLNHATGACPLAALYWDGINQRPSSDNPWFNVTATHPFNVFNDFNHQSPDTRYFSLRVMEHWLKNFNIDGYRFDLSKGFTQVKNPNDVGRWSDYDPSRVAIWRLYHDSIQQYSPGAYTILEHFADNGEESALANYGMLLWGNANYAYGAATRGIHEASTFDWSVYQTRGWSQPHLVSYMESHDEERLMYLNLQSGLSSGTYNIRDFNTAVERNKMAAAFFLLTPGPKLIWQFGELAYDFSINTCQNGMIDNNCRLDNKPPGWPLLQNAKRKELYDWYKRLIEIRNFPWFKGKFSQASLQYRLNSPMKYLSLQSDSISLVVAGNFDIQPVTASVRFPRTGTWYDLKDSSSISVETLFTDLNLMPGEYHVYTDRKLDVTTPVKYVDAGIHALRVLPNPSRDLAFLEISAGREDRMEIGIFGVDGKPLPWKHQLHVIPGTQVIELPSLVSPGMYLIRVAGARGVKTVKWSVN